MADEAARAGRSAGPAGLRRRLALALTLLAALAVAALGAAFWVGEAIIEQSNLERLMARELEFRIESGAPPPEINARSATLHYFRPALSPGRPPPGALAQLGPGGHAHVPIGSARYYVLVRRVGDGDFAYLAFDTSIADRREHWMLGTLGGGVVSVVLAAWLLSGWVARHTLRPLDALVARIRSLDIALRGERLEPLAASSELNIIVTAVNAQIEALEALVQRESAFAAAASHELRTRLAVIGGAADVLAARDPSARQVTGRIERAVAEMRADLDALLALSRSREPPPEQSIALHEWLPQLAEPYLHAAQVEWSLEPVTRDVSPGALAVIFTNLVRNAERAAPAGKLRVELRPGAIAVIDDGEGMPEEMLVCAFEPGTRGRDGGSGLGLYISQQLALRCGWRVVLRNRPGGGTRAELRLEEPSENCG